MMLYANVVEVGSETSTSMRDITEDGYKSQFCPQHLLRWPLKVTDGPEVFLLFVILTLSLHY